MSDGTEGQERLLRRVDEELQQALDVAPSPELLPRVRERVAGEAAVRRPWGLSWLIPVAASLAFVTFVTTFVRRPVVEQPSARATAARQSPPAIVQPAEPPEAVTPANTTANSSSRVEPRRQAPEILVFPGDEEALRRFVAAIRTGRVDVSALVKDEVQTSPDLGIAPLEELAPLELRSLSSEIDSEGVME